MAFNPKALLASHRAASQIAVKFVVGTFHKFFTEVLKCGLNFKCFDRFNFLVSSKNLNRKLKQNLNNYVVSPF